MKRYAIKIDVSDFGSIENYGYGIVYADSEKEAHKEFVGNKIGFIFEIPKCIHHWGNYELSVYYAWIDGYRHYWPVDSTELVDDYLANNGEERRKWIEHYIDIFGNYMENINIFNQYNKLIEMLNSVVPTKNKV